MIQIRFLFKAIDLDHSLPCDSTAKLNECIQRRKCALEAEHKLLNIKAFIRTIAHSSTHQYLPFPSAKADRAIASAKESIVVEFFHASRAESLRARLSGVAGQLQRRERELKTLMNELEDESRLFYAMQIISKASKTSFSDFEDVIEVAVAVAEPLVDCQGGRLLPLFYEQVDVCSHV
jgi:hypothetical protein